MTEAGDLIAADSSDSISGGWSKVAGAASDGCRIVGATVLAVEMLSLRSEGAATASKSSELS